jgi:hypothetical protein
MPQSRPFCHFPLVRVQVGIVNAGSGGTGCAPGVSPGGRGQDVRGKVLRQSQGGMYSGEMAGVDGGRAGGANVAGLRWQLVSELAAGDAGCACDDFRPELGKDVAEGRDFLAFVVF